jgi:hypothetical protein
VQIEVFGEIRDCAACSERAPEIAVGTDEIRSVFVQVGGLGALVEGKDVKRDPALVAASSQTR